MLYCACVDSGVPQPHCYTVNGGRYKAIYPKDIWELDDPFGRLVRRLFYGSEEIRMPRPCIDELVPNIAHMVWLGGGRMDYVFYLSVLSVLYVAKVDRLYIHGDKPPAGDLWQKVRQFAEGNTRKIQNVAKLNLSLWRTQYYTLDIYDKDSNNAKLRSTRKQFYMIY